jgi:hypothetical protein
MTTENAVLDRMADYSNSDRGPHSCDEEIRALSAQASDVFEPFRAAWDFPQHVVLHIPRAGHSLNFLSNRDQASCYAFASHPHAYS